MCECGVCLSNTRLYIEALYECVCEWMNVSVKCFDWLLRPANCYVNVLMPPFVNSLSQTVFLVEMLTSLLWNKSWDVCEGIRAFWMQESFLCGGERLVCYHCFHPSLQSDSLNSVFDSYRFLWYLLPCVSVGCFTSCHCLFSHFYDCLPRLVVFPPASYYPCLSCVLSLSAECLCSHTLLLVGLFNFPVFPCASVL